jgi:DNA-binding transcriptional MerR regulator
MTDHHSPNHHAAPEGADPSAATRLLPASVDESTMMLSWAVGTVAEHLGVSTSTLRSWERRYGLGPTRRTGGNHRRYAPPDVLRVQLMARLTAQGVPARAAAMAIGGLDDREVAARLVASSEGSSRGSAPGSAELDADLSAGTVDDIVSAALALDATTLTHLYRTALRRLELDTAWTGVLVPALRRIGEEWATGRLDIGCEHLASDLLQAELRALVRARRGDASGPPVLLAAADDEQHHLPLIAVEAELARLGVPAVHFGPRMPARSTVAAVQRTRPRAVFLWASMARDPGEPFWDLLGGASGPRRVVVGGPGWPVGFEQRHPALDVCRVEDLASAVAALAE